jgi:hypothetical protein
MQKPKAFIESRLRLCTKVLVLNKAMLEINSPHNSHTVAKSGIRHFKVFRLDELKKVYDPAGVQGELLKGVSQEGLRHRSPEITQAHGQKKGVIQ